MLFLVPQPCLILCDPVDCSPPIFSVHGILQATILEWVARPSSRGSSSPKEQTLVSYVSCIGRSANSTTWEAWIRCSAHQKCLRNIFENDFLYFFFNLVQGVVTKSEHRYETKMTTKNLSLCFELSTLWKEQGSFCSVIYIVLLWPLSLCLFSDRLGSWLSAPLKTAAPAPPASSSSDTVGKLLPQAKTDHLHWFFFSSGLCKKQWMYSQTHYPYILYFWDC